MFGLSSSTANRAAHQMYNSGRNVRPMAAVSKPSTTSTVIKAVSITGLSVGFLNFATQFIHQLAGKGQTMATRKLHNERIGFFNEGKADADKKKAMSWISGAWKSVSQALHNCARPFAIFKDEPGKIDLHNDGNKWESELPTSKP